MAEPASSKAVLRFESRPDILGGLFAELYSKKKRRWPRYNSALLLRQQNTKTPNNRNNKNIVQPLNEHICIPENNAKLDHIKFGI